MEPHIRIFELNECDCRYLEPINSLLSQLSVSPAPFTADNLQAIVSSPDSHLFLIENEGAVCGMLTLGCYHSPTGHKLWIEDVVVDASMRGRSFGRRLVEHAIGFSKQIGGTLMLTSRPSRIAANSLYQSMGFESKETNVYKMKV